MKKVIGIAALFLTSLSVTAQETYENTKLVDNDLNGTARYVGMGGAMEALGADLSIIESNPAGIGLFRHSMISGSFGLVAQQGAPSYAQGSKTFASFDQIGFVWSKQGKNSFVNFAFNYNKSKNFDYILAAAGNPRNASQNMQSFIKGAYGDENRGGFDIGIDNQTEEYIGYTSPTSDKTSLAFNQLDYLYWNAFIVDTDGNYGYNTAQDFLFNREHTGYIGSYDLNISGNINDRVYLGLTFGFKDVHYKGYTRYLEGLQDNNNSYVGDVSIEDDRRITGSGFNVSAGAIIRPVEESPFRIGFSVTTPTWYDLTTENHTYLINDTPYGLYDDGKVWNVYDFKLYTPWKFGVSLGHTVGNYLALGASYEYAAYGSMDTRVNEGVSYSWYYDEFYDSSHSDQEMNNHTKKTLKGVSTFKFGIEGKPTPELSLRAGHNYVSPMYETSGYKDGGLKSLGSSYSSATDYTNWEATNRFTLGMGYKVGQFNFDLAWQYSAQNGTFYPYKALSVVDGNTTHEMTADKFDVSNKRHQVLMTIGYHF